VSEQFLPGSLTICRAHDPVGVQDFMRLELRDGASHIKFIEIRMDLAALMVALTGLCEQSCTFNLQFPDLVGMRHEVDSILAPIPETSVYGDEFVAMMREQVDAILRERSLTVTGWRASDYDLRRNQHRISNGHMSIPIHRYVKPEQESL
jgi:hypothetical protein